MERQLTPSVVKDSLNAHAAEKGMEIHQRYGPQLGWKELQSILNDIDFVRYPCELKFGSAGLLQGECAHPVCRGERPEDGFIMYVHPLFMTQLDRVPYLVLYQLVLVNYGEFAAVEDAEAFGANALGISKDTYYAVLCELADQLSCSAITETRCASHS